MSQLSFYSNLLVSFTSVKGVHPAFAIPTESLSAPFMIDTQCVACTGFTAQTVGTHTHTLVHTLSVSGYSNDSWGVAECYYSMEGSHSSKWPLGAHMCFRGVCVCVFGPHAL